MAALRAVARAWPLWLFPMMVWFVGSFFLLGDLGKTNDDYAAHWRDPVTGGFAWGDLLRYPWWFFWRPVHVHLVYTLQTLLWNHDWANHLFSAMMHGLACVSAWHFLKDAGVRSWIAAAALVLLLCAPQGFEAIFWPATVSTSIGAAGLFLAAKIVLRYSQGRHRPSGRWVLAGLGVLVPCCYEQPAAAMSMLPLVYIAGMLDRERRSAGVRAMSIGRHAIRMIGLLTPVAIGISSYLVLYGMTVRHDPFARESQIVLAEGFWPRMRSLAEWLLYMLDPTSGFRSAWATGVSRLASARAWEVGVLAMAAVGGVAWVVAMGRGWSRGARPEADVQKTGRACLVLIALFLVAAMAMALVPVIAIQGAGLSSRLSSLLVMCMVLCFAALGEAIARSVSHRASAMVIRNALLGAVVLASGWCCVVLIGIQAMYQQRHATDMASLRDLVDRLPDPAPGTIFVPMKLKAKLPANPGARTKVPIENIWQSPWAINTMIKHAYRRADVHAATIYFHNQSMAIIRLGPTTRMNWSHYFWKLPTPRMVDEFAGFTPQQFVPIQVNERGLVDSIDRVLAMKPGGEEFEFVVRQRLRQRRGDAQPAEVRVAVPIDDGGEWLRHWTWASGSRSGTRVKFGRAQAFGAAELGARMHPPTPGVRISEGETDAMITELRASDRAATIVFWATFDEQTIDLSAKGDGVELIWSIDGEGEIARATIDPKLVQRERRWVRVAVEVPAASAVRQLRLSVGPGVAGNNSYDRVIVSCGSLMPSP